MSNIRQPDNVKGFKFIKAYKHNDKYRLSFNELAHETFGIDFEKWYQMGLWNDRYICYSYADGDSIISNVSVNVLELIINGERKSAIQLGTVMTHPDYRKRGLAGSLVKIVLEEYENKCDLIYLFPNVDALDFYLKFGFVSYQESTLYKEISIEQPNKGTFRKMDITNNDDLGLLAKLVSERIPSSTILGAFKAEAILAWYAVNVFSENIYYFEDMNIIVIFDIEGDKLNLYDVISRGEVDINEVVDRIVDSEIKRVMYHFTPDQEYVSEYEKVDNLDDLLFIKGDVNNLPEYFRHPITAHA